jgi:hypothetical protein
VGRWLAGAPRTDPSWLQVDPEAWRSSAPRAYTRSSMWGPQATPVTNARATAGTSDRVRAAPELDHAAERRAFRSRRQASATRVATWNLERGGRSRAAHPVLSENSIGGAMRPPANSGPVRRRGVRGVGSLPCRVARTAAG